MANTANYNLSKINYTDYVSPTGAENVSAEVINAKKSSITGKTFDTLGKRMDDTDSSLAQNTTYLTVSAISNVFTLDISKCFNFAIETTDTNAKTIAFSNVPTTVNTILSISVKLKYTNAAAITFPASVTWQNSIIPTFTTAKQTLIQFLSYDNGVTWLGFASGAW